MAAAQKGNQRLEGATLYRALWRWHFYAGLWCIPFVILLALTGSMYLFKPQFEAWQDRAFELVAFAGPRIGPAAEVATALHAVTGAKFAEYELPHAARAAGRVWLRGADGEKIRADADRQREVILADAYREAQKVKGEGDAKASAIYAEAFGRDPQFASFYRSLEAYKSSFANKSDVMVLDPSGSEFFKTFRNGGGAAPAAKK